MISFEKQLFINRPQQELFDYVSNPDNDVHWRDSIVLAEWSSAEPHGVGSTQHLVDKFMGREIDSTVEITSWEPPHRFSQKMVSGPIPFEMTMNFKPAEQGTQLSIIGQAEFRGFFKLAEGLVRRQLEKVIDSEFNSLKRLMEEGGK